MIIKLCKPKAIFIFVIMLFTCFGCGRLEKQEKTRENNENVIDLMEMVRQDGEIADQAETIVLWETDEESVAVMDAFCINATDFAIMLLRENMQIEEGNVLISPVSLLNILSMTANGAGSDTHEQMLSVLTGSQDAERMNQNMKIWMDHLKSAENIRIQIANSIWFHENAEHFTVEENFLKQNAMYYDADIYQLPLAENTVSVMNRWVSDKTEGEIGSIIEELPEDAVLTLIGTVTFDAGWQRVYDEYQINDGFFTSASGEKENVSMMYASEYRYFEDENAKGFIKPYQSGYSFVAILPDEGMTPTDYIRTLDGAHFREMLTDTGLKDNMQLKTCMPKFRVEYNIELSSILKSMGISDAFDESKADFSGMGSTDNNQNIYIDTLWHKTCITVDELGTKARAATAGASAEASEEPDWEIIYVYLHRPFIYAIIDDQTNIPIFIGVVNSINPF